MFTPNNVDIEILSARAYNLRWATLPKGVIPLTAADPDFPVAASHPYERNEYSLGAPSARDWGKQSLAISRIGLVGRRLGAWA